MDKCRTINVVIPIPLLCHFTVYGQENAQNMPAFYTVQFRFDLFFADGGRSIKKMYEIMSLLFGVLLDNTRRHFTQCSHFLAPCGARKNAMTQLVKYPRVSSTKTPSKVCIFAAEKG